MLYSNHFGYIDRENKIAADENCVYEWGSISKMFTWVSVMQLYEQGDLDLNADIRTYLPGDFITKLAYEEPITMLHLMNHNAGWQESVGLMVRNEEDIVPLEEALRNSEPAQIWKPGEVTAYSNWGAALAGYIVERVSGMDYADYLHENILEPLGMEQTSVSADYRDREWVRTQREKEKAYLVLDKETMGVDADISLGTNMNYILLYPAGAVTGTLGDITKFAQAFVDDECPLFEKQETLDLMLSASDFYGESDIPRVCHGIFPMQYAVTALAHDGSTLSGSANLTFDLESKVGVVVLTNQYASGILYEIPKMIFGSIIDNPIAVNAEITTRNDISGNYITSRSYIKGIGKISGCLQRMAIESTGNPDEFTSGGEPFMTRVGDDLYFTAGEDLLYETTMTDGTGVLALYAADYIQNDAAGIEFASILLFAVIAAVTVVMLITKGIMKLIRKYKAIPAGKAILAGQLARAAIFLILPFLLVISLLPRTFLVIFALAAGTGAVVCAISAGFTAKALVTESEMKRFTRVRYALSVLCELFVVGFVLYFQLFNFWT